MNVPPASPRERRQWEQAVYAVAERLGIDEDGARRHIQRAGGPKEALAKLRDRERRAKAGILRRLEREELDQIATARRAVHADRQRANRADRRAARERTTLGYRLDQVLAAANQLTSTSAASLSPHVSSGKADSTPPPLAVPLDVSFRLEVIRHQVEQIEREVDVARGLDEPVNWSRMPAAKKDDIILSRFEGVRAEDLARDIPELGSKRTIERVRLAHGRRGSDGRPVRRARSNTNSTGG